MGCAASRETIESRRIDKWQASAANERSKVINLLLIGSGDSGKTTLRKQITNVHNKTFDNPEYRQSFVPTISDNLLDGCMTLLDCLDGVAYKEAAAVLQAISAARTNDEFISAQLAEAILKLLDDQVFATALHTKQKEIHLQECFMIYIQSIREYPKWGGKGWIPTVDECIRARTRTSGIIKETCVIDNLEFCIIDVGGQRAERRKWLHVFEDVTACIFVAALSDYDIMLFEDNKKNRLEEALELFSECVNSQWLYNIPTLLFLNKMDVFERKFMEEKIPLNISGRFPDAPAKATSEEAMKWISNQFVQRKAMHKRVSPNPNKSTQVAKTYVHYTTATDPENIRRVFDVAVSVILKATLKRAGFAGN